MEFIVKSLQADAAVAISRLQAANAVDARQQAEGMGLDVLSIAPASWLSRLSKPQGGAKFPLLLFSQELLQLLNSGVSLVEAVETLAEKEARPAVRDVLQGIISSLRQGKPFSAALEEAPQAFEALYVASVRASEHTSGLSESLARYVAYATQLETLRGRLVSAAIYPVILVAVSSLVILFLMGYVVPRFAHIYEDMGGDLPFLSRLLLQGGLLLEEYWYVVWLALGAVALVLLAGGARLAGKRLLGLLWRIPAVGERMRVYQLARLYRTLGMLLRGGIAIVPALEMVTGLLSTSLQPRLVEASRRVREGQAISHSFEVSGLTTAVSLRMLRVGERAGNMGEMMERAAAFHDDEMARWAEWVTRLLGPLLMLVMGLVIGTVVVLMYMPIFQLAESVK
ncbi:type II secretion system protein [Rhodoferax lacus]|uniref:Type II secretion system protein n=1 Tax=Rhodoferax lacus TaxID=2184758 RepID=A0A3E1RAV4_9BURK|nr:type II secretion system F family protein [Rhodoferax lacus]RFO95790.1 type II secretion system protein [Rhodoferax lacus]